jgi:hypothetical protein
MRREDIPARLRVARPADCQRIPLAALKSMAPADVGPRLAAADEYRRRARVPHLDADVLRYRLGLATEVLTTADPKRAADLVKAAGVQVAPQPPAAPASRTAVRPAALSKAGPAADAAFPALNLFQRKSARAMSTNTGLMEMAREGRLGALETDIGRLRRAVDAGASLVPSGRSAAPPTADVIKSARAQFVADLDTASARLSKAARYERQAGVVSDPELRKAYIDLARQERENAGAAR